MSTCGVPRRTVPREARDVGEAGARAQHGWRQSDVLELRDSAPQITDDGFTSAGQSDYCGVAEIRVSVCFRRGAAAVNDVGCMPVADAGWAKRGASERPKLRVGFGKSDSCW